MSVTLKYNGKPFSARAFERDLMKAAVQAVAGELHERIGAARDPQTGEFPTVLVRGDTLDDMSLIVEGSPRLFEIIKGQLSEEEAALVDFKPLSAAPCAFLSYASEDRALAKRIAADLQGRGIETWWDGWEIGPGDSIVAKINEGLAGCTHFIVLLTPNSIDKPWVRSEMDAGFVRRVDGETIFIALRHDLKAEALPPLLKPLNSPSIGVRYEDDIRQLVHDIHGATRKPPLGKKPEALEQPAAPYSPAAMAVARFFCENSKGGFWADVQTSRPDIAAATGLSEDDVTDALFELRNFMRKDAFAIMAESKLYTEFDKYFFDRDPAADALVIAAAMQNDLAFPEKAIEIAERLDWQPRRLNPALAYLVDRKLVRETLYLGGGPFVATEIARTDATRRFVKSRL